MSARRSISQPLLLAIPVLVATFGLTYLSGRFQSRRAAAESTGYIENASLNALGVLRFEDLPVAPAHRTDDLPVAPLRRSHALRPDQITPALVRKADQVLWAEDRPLGTEIPIHVGDRVYIGRVETHFHEVGGPKKPWGYHKGLTIYAVQ